MSKILSPSELNEVKIFAEKLGFEYDSKFGYAQISKAVNEATAIGVFYDVVLNEGYVEITFSPNSITTDEYEDFVKVLGEAQSIAKEMEK